MEERKIRVAITQGDTNGTGFELIFKAFEDPAMLELFIPIIYGSPKIAVYHRKALGMDVGYSIISNVEDAKAGRLNLLACFDEEIKVELGQSSPESVRAAQVSLEQAMADVSERKVDALVAVPAAVNDVLLKKPEALVIRTVDDLRVSLLTNGLALRNVADAITKTRIVEKATIFHQALRRDFRISCPRIAVLALNPHAGDDGLLGTEEKDIILPAIEQLAESGIQAFGPYAADGFFGSGNFNYFDGVLAMYHDQGLAPFKTIALDDGVNYTAGLPIVRTSPDHGTAYDIAGQGKADENSLRQAIYTAIDIWRNRQVYDEPLQNPLPKLFHEKREDGNRARFAQPRSKDLFKKEKSETPETEQES